MKLIVGLGNPGDKYQFTRHNLGLRVARALREDGLECYFFQPNTFYNQVGSEIINKLSFYKLSPHDLLIIHDELDLLLGEIKLQFGKNDAGNHGVESIITALGGKEFWRLRIGIGPRGNIPGDQFVLERFSKVEEVKLNEEVIPSAKELVKGWLNA